jgi:hypothetical protein
VVCEPHRETSWPETLVLDTTEFAHTDRWTGQRSQLFTVLAAYGYPAGQRHGRLWALHASPRDDGDAWKEFLAGLPGRPAVVIVDDDRGIKNGVRRRWPGVHTPAIHQCEHHLYVKAREAMARDEVPDDRELHELLNAAFTSPAAWQAFESEVRRNLGQRGLNRWVTHWAPLLQGQLACRAAHPADMPGHWANGAIAAPIRTAREVIGDRAWTLRNRTRLNLLLDLVRLRINKLDWQAVYASAIRKHLDATGGRPAHKAAIPDQDDAHARRVYSLRV